MRKKEAEFLEALFDGLNPEDYCVLRNYETLPLSLNGSDLDLMVRPSKMKHIEKLLVEKAELNGGKVISSYQTTGRYFKILGKHNGGWWGAAVDLMPGIDYRGMIYIGADEIIDRAHKYKNITVANDQDVELLAFLKEVVNNGKTQKNYFTNASTAYREFGESSLDVLKTYFSEGFRSYLVTVLEDSQEDKEVISLLAKKMRSELYLKQLPKQYKEYFTNQLKRISRLFKPAGMSIAFVGTDGAGKSTIIEGIKPMLEQATHMPVHYEHLRPNLLSSLGEVSGKSKVTGEVVTDPHAKPPSGLIGSFVRLCYYASDYVFGYWLKTYPRIIKKAQICIFDRYFYDIVADPLRMRIQLPSWIMRAAFWLAPEPKLVLCLGANPDVIFERKPETSLAEVTRQVGFLKLFCEEHKRAFWIDTSKGIEASVDDALVTIQSVMSGSAKIGEMK